MHKCPEDLKHDVELVRYAVLGEVLLTSSRLGLSLQVLWRRALRTFGSAS